jgi:hypothetical protein
MQNLPPSKNTGIFCLLNCFDNYAIVASKLIEFYIQNAAKAIQGRDVQTMSFFEKTPYVLYQLYMLPSAKPLGTEKFSKQYTDFITILGLTAVTLARIYDSEAVVFAHQGVVPYPGFATMYAAANTMNKITAYWTDDLRNLWGTSDDPLMIGMAPMPYKYLWTASMKPDQTPAFNVQPKGLNGPLSSPNIGSDTNRCPVMDEDKFKGKWNSFLALLRDGQSVQRQNTSAINKRMSNLINIGMKIITYVENTKDAKYGRGWVPGASPQFNSTLFSDMNLVIGQNKSLLYNEEAAFIDANTGTDNVSDTSNMASVSMIDQHEQHTRATAMASVYEARSAAFRPDLIPAQQAIASAMVLGFQKMMS